ncbi:MAG: protein of unassigned function [Methylobacterium brachiatum]|nr:protein of unassigned function [Methylobacterium brachiatum]
MMRTAQLSLRVAFAAMLMAAGPLAAQTGPSPAADVAFLDALTWGATPSAFAQLRRDGRARWLQAQLHPPAEPRLPPAAQAQVDALTPPGTLLERARSLDAQSKAAKDLADPEARKAAQSAFQAALNDAARNAASAWVLRALYSSDQLRERLTWFWFNRLNVHQGKSTLRAAVGDYVDTAIRPHVLGRFRDLLMASLRHPAMLRYLDNDANAAGHINENYAREIMELHTMGVGSGYSQADVESLARILTGVGIDLKPESPKLRPEHAADFIRDGLFEFNPNRHDYGDKTFLGTRIRGRGWPEVEEALDLIARHPATASSVSRALATYFLGQAPDDALVARLAAIFTRTDGDIAAVMEALIREPAFAAAQTSAFKDPVRYVFSALRMAYDERVILNTGPVLGWLNRLGEGLFNRSTPDGYALDAAAWSGPGQLTTRFEIARQIGSGPAGLFKPAAPDRPEEPAFPVLANALYFSTLAGTLSAPTKGALAQAVSPQDWNTLYLASPEFMR